MKKPRSQRRKGEAYEAYLPPGDQSRYLALAYSVRLVSQAGKCVGLASAQPQLLATPGGGCLACPFAKEA